jgi:hypothetical protein
MTRVRKLDANKDMTFGHSAADFYVNQAELVAQNIDTALRLILGEWFLDTTQGVDWGGKILGRTSNYDAEFQRVILNVSGVDSIASYFSDLQDRTLSVTVQVNTIYTQEVITMAINLSTQYSGNTWPQIGISYVIGQSIIL